MVIIADDLTGANDSAVQFKKFGFSTIVKVAYEGKDESNFYKNYDILSINADTRPLSSKQAYDKVYEIVKQMYNDDMDCLYKKIDSVLRGNPGSELDAVMDAMNCRLALVAPSFPENGRLIVGSILTVGVTSINVVEIFTKGMKRRVQGVPLEIVRSGEEKLKEFITFSQTKGVEVFVLDACTDEDLKIIKDTSKLIIEKKVLCGSAGLAKQLSIGRAAEKLLEQGTQSVKKEKKRVILATIGSRTIETALQAKRVSEIFQVPIVTVEIGQIIDGKEQMVIEKCTQQLLSEIEKGQELVILAVDSLFEDYSLVLKNSEEEYGQSLRIVETLGTIVKAVNDKVNLYAIISAGGDTSLQICKAFGTLCIELLDEIVTGIPLGRMVGGQADSLLIVTKSGGFGVEDVLIRVIEYLREYKAKKIQ